MYAYLEAMWKCRYFWLSLVKIDLRSRYRGSIVGIAWSLLHPVGMTIILATVFRSPLGAAGGDPREQFWQFVTYLFTGLTFWNFFANTASQGCQCFFQGESYIRQYPAPMAIYPLRTALGSAFHFSVALLLVLAATGFRQGGLPLPAVLSLAPTLVLVLAFGWSVAVLLGLLNVRFRDTSHLTEVALSGLFFLTPVVLDLEWMKEARPRLHALMQCNPLNPFLDLLRAPVVKGQVPHLTTYALALLIVLLLTGAGMLALRSQERRLIFHL